MLLQSKQPWLTQIPPALGIVDSSRSGDSFDAAGEETPEDGGPCFDSSS